MEDEFALVMKSAETGYTNFLHLALMGTLGVEPRELARPRGRRDVPLVIACLRGHLDVVRILVDEWHVSLNVVADVTVHKQNVEGANPLWCGTASGNLDLVRYLVQKGADVNETTTVMKSSPLRAACYNGHLPIVEYLIQHGADVNSANVLGHSVLMLACALGHVDIVSFLLKHNADVNCVVPYSDTCSFVGSTPLHSCVESGRLEIARLLLENGATITRNSKGETPLLKAALKGLEDFVNFLIDIPDCSRYDKVDALEILGTFYLDKKKDKDKCFSLWNRAMEERHYPGKFEIFKREVESKLSDIILAVEVQTMEGLLMVQMSDSLIEIRSQVVLMKQRVLGGNHEETLLSITQLAVEYADAHIFDKSIKLIFFSIEAALHRCVFDLKTTKLYCFLAAIFSRQENDVQRYEKVMAALEYSIKELERAGKNKGQESNKALTPLRHEFLKAVLHLVFHAKKCLTTEYEGHVLAKTVRHIVQMNVRGKHGDTLLHMACNGDTARLVGFTAICTFNPLEVVQELLKARSDVRAHNENGYTPLQVAKGNNQDVIPQIVGLLESAEINYLNEKTDV